MPNACRFPAQCGSAASSRRSSSLLPGWCDSILQNHLARSVENTVEARAITQTSPIVNCCPCNCLIRRTVVVLAFFILIPSVAIGETPALATSCELKRSAAGSLSAAHKRSPCDSMMDRLMRSPMPVWSSAAIVASRADEAVAGIEILHCPGCRTMCPLFAPSHRADRSLWLRQFVMGSHGDTTSRAVTSVKTSFLRNDEPGLKSNAMESDFQEL
jgi:hypothetical protein